jgi:hypothetical protein
MRTSENFVLSPRLVHSLGPERFLALESAFNETLGFSVPLESMPDIDLFGE